MLFISAIQQSYLTVYMCVYILFFILFSISLSQDIEYTSLCHTVGPNAVIDQVVSFSLRPRGL